MKKAIFTKKSIAEYIAVFLILVATVLMFFSFSNKNYTFSMGDTSSYDYLKARVIEVVETNLVEYGDSDGTLTGQQKINVKFTEGSQKGQVVSLINYVTIEHNVVLKQGDKVIISVDAPEGVEPYYTFYNRDRSSAILGILICFALLVMIIGKRKGLMSLIGLLFTIGTVLCILLPNIYEGRNPFLFASLVALLSAAVTCFCISGFSKKTILNMLGAFFGCASSALVYKIFMELLGLSGTNLEEAETLIIVSGRTGLSLKNLLLASIMVVSLGAVMDVAVSMGAALSEIKELNPDTSAKQLWKSGMNIGRDMIGTMTNTLILAFVGGTLATLLVLISYGVHTTQLLSSNFIALELAQGIAGSAAVVLTVPISAAICSIGYTNNFLKKR